MAKNQTFFKFPKKIILSGKAASVQILFVGDNLYKLDATL